MRSPFVLHFFIEDLKQALVAQELGQKLVIGAALGWVSVSPPPNTARLASRAFGWFLFGSMAPSVDSLMLIP